jgi:uncharacterized protein YkwD
MPWDERTISMRIPLNRSRHLVSAVVAILCIASIGSSPAHAQQKKVKIDLPLLVELHNKERAKEKLGALKVNAKLTAAAELHAKWMAENEKLSHEGADGSDPAKRVKDQGYLFERIGENVAQGQKNSTIAMKAWMDSPHHKENILKPEFTEIGVACKISESGEPYWAADFGTPWPEIEVPRDTAAMYAALNAARAEVKKAPFLKNPTLEIAAKQHAEAMAEAGKFLQTDPDGQRPTSRAQKSGYRARAIGQCDASGQYDAKKVVESWLGDKEEAKTVILGSHEDIGIGVARSKEGVPFWCVIVGRTRGPIER